MNKEEIFTERGFQDAPQVAFFPQQLSDELTKGIFNSPTNESSCHSKDSTVR